MHPKDFIAAHPQIYPASCSAWGLEAVIKLHKKRLPSPSPFQERCKNGCGFEDAFLEELRVGYGVSTSKKAYAQDMSGFKRDAVVEISKGLFPLVAIPSLIAFDIQSQAMQIACHTYVVTENHGQLEFYTRRHGDSVPYIIPESKMAQVHHSWIKCIPLHDGVSGLLLNALFHRPS